MRAPILPFLLGLFAAAALSCFTSSDPLFCQGNSDCSGSRPLCDLTGELPGSEGLGNTCVGTQSCSNSSTCDSSAPICDTDGQCQPCDSAGGDDACSTLSAGAPVCSSAGQCVECDTSADCGDLTRPICESNVCVACTDAASSDACATKDADAAVCVASGAGAGRCVECETSAECGGDTPVCSPEGECTGCSEHSDCPSLVCDRENGMCIDEASIFYLAESGDGGNDEVTCGAVAEPCESIDYVIDTRLPSNTARNWLKLAVGDFSSGTGGADPIVITDKTVQIVGTNTATGSVLLSNGSIPVVLVTDNADVLLDEVTIRSGSGGAQCLGSPRRASLRVFRANVTNNGNLDENVGVQGTTCDVSIEQSTISNNGFGVSVTNSALAIERSDVRLNPRGGLQLTNSELVVLNNYIVLNGTDGVSGFSGFGGVSITGSPSNGLVSFNTIVGNEAGMSADSAGLDCSQSTQVTASNNIIWLNDRQGAAGDDDLSLGLCAVTFSTIGQVVGDGNLMVMPVFEDLGPGEFGLTPVGNDMLEGAADPSSTISVDYDGDIRPQGTGRDIGADEIAE